jgi:hypothetical protein
MLSQKNLAMTQSHPCCGPETVPGPPYDVVPGTEGSQLTELRYSASQVGHQEGAASGRLEEAQPLMLRGSDAVLRCHQRLERARGQC